MVWSLRSPWWRTTKATASHPVPQIASARIAASLRSTAVEWQARLGPVSAAGSVTPAGRLAPALQHLDHDLTRKPRVAILGEFNAGKSTLANLLARSHCLETNVLANTRVATLIRHVDDEADHLLVPERRRADADVQRSGPVLSHVPFDYEVVLSRAPLLKSCTLLDTPGLSDPTHADEIADLYARIADIAIWCSIASQCWRESERQAWDRLSGRLRRYGILVLTGADAVPGQADRSRIRARLDREAAGRFGAIVFLSARDARRAFDAETGRITDPELWASSGAAELDAIVGRVVNHVAEQRLLRSRRWAHRLLRHMAEVQPRDLGPAWWVAPLRFFAMEGRSVTVALRGHRVDRAGATTTIRSAIDTLEDTMMPALSRLGLGEEARRVAAAFTAARTALDQFGMIGPHGAAVDHLAAIGTRLFHDISLAMRGAERESAAIAALEDRLLDIVGSKKSGSTASGY
jgi:energy-coupling factor transporter ATP-binding protein EcfA2